MDTSPFDDKKLKSLSWLSQRLWLVAVLCIAVIALTIYLKLLPNLAVLVSLILLGYMWLFSDSWLPGDAFASKNHMDKFFLKHDTDYVFMRDQYQSVKRSAFMKHEEFMWSITINSVEVPMMFTRDGGCVMWLQLDRSFPHIVVDALGDNHWFKRQVEKKNMPSQKVQLEGDFPDYFRVYMDPGQQVTTLQILAPDRMLYLVDSLRNFNLEIQDKYLRLFAARAQRSSTDFKNMVDAVASLDKGLKLASLNAIKG
jgi:hypothetical protein